jgi:tRNA dimethylallyltransferase
MRPVIIAGPTASGKSALALSLADRDDGVVINADALQVYSCWRILTARPDIHATARVPHRLYGHVACDAPYSVGRWLREVEPLLDELRHNGRRPIVVGGAGLYLSALTEGLAAIPSIPADLRARSAALIAAGALDTMLDDLARDDPETHARIDRANPMRVQRAWEVLKATGRGLSDWHRGKTRPVLASDDAVRMVLSPENHILDRHIIERFDAMLKDGALEECARFRGSGIPLTAPAGRALGAAELIDSLEGRLSIEAAREAAITATRRYAKRQRAWFRNRFADWHWLDPCAGDPLADIPRN